MKIKREKIVVPVVVLFLVFGNENLVGAMTVSFLETNSGTMSTERTLSDFSDNGDAWGWPGDRTALILTNDYGDEGADYYVQATNDYKITLKISDVTSGAVGAVTGGDLYNELHLSSDGNYIRQTDTTGVNLAALNTELQKRDLTEMTVAEGFRIGSNSSRDADKILNTAYTVTTDTAVIERENTGFITGGGLYDEIHVTGGNIIKGTNTVSQNLRDLDTQVKINADQVEINTEAIKNLREMSNLTEVGQKEIKNLAQGIIQIKGDNASILIEDVKDEATGNITYKVTTKDALVERGNTGILTANNSYTEFRADGHYIRADRTVGTNLAVLDAQIKTNADSILDLEKRIGDRLDVIAGQMNHVAAGAAALAALHPENYDPSDKWSFALGYGQYKNVNATAMGVFFKPKAMMTFSAGGTIGSGSRMFQMGASFKRGRADKEVLDQGTKNVTLRVEELENAILKQDVAIEVPAVRMAKWEADYIAQVKRLDVLEADYKALRMDWFVQMKTNRAQEKELVALSKEMATLHANREKIQNERTRLKERLAALLTQMEITKGERE